MLIYHGRVAVDVKERRKQLANRSEKDYFCTVVSEDVKIALRNRPFLSHKSNNELFVKCNQRECQYIDLNRLPCLLRLDLFAEEIEMRKKRAQR